MGPKYLTRTSLLLRVGLSFAALLISLVIAALVGSQPLSIAGIIQNHTMDREVFFALRVPRALMAAVAGGSLALAGVLFQALLRDSLATPYTLGVSSGASLGAVIAIYCGLDTIAGLPAVTGMALVGAGMVLATIARIAHRTGLSSTSLLLAGITLNSICGAVILFMSNLAGFLQSITITRWLMGGLDPPSYPTLLGLSVIVLPTAAIAWRLARSWNLLSLGEDWANSHGVPARKLLISGYVVGSVLAGVITAYTGPIGFVGLIVPHALRLRLGADHRVLIPCSFLLGGAFLALSDVISRVLLAPTEIPVGVITALLGGPVFIWMLYSRQAHERA